MAAAAAIDDVLDEPPPKPERRKGIDRKDCVDFKPSYRQDVAGPIINGCPVKVEAGWRITLSKGKKPAGGQQNLAIGGNWVIQEPKAEGETFDIVWGACEGYDTFVWLADGEYKCLPPR